MKFNFGKIASAAASTALIGSTIALAVAANYPAPFVQNGAADVGIVWGSSALNSDLVAAANIQSDLSDALDAQSKGSGNVVVDGDVWQVKTGTDELEIGEPLFKISSFIDSDEWDLLAGGSITNEKGTSKYEEFFYFIDDEATAGTNVSVVYEEDDEDMIGDFLKFPSGTHIAVYELDFTTTLDSDITTAGRLEDIEDKDIKILGKEFTITKAENLSTGAKLTLMSGVEKLQVYNGEVYNVNIDGKQYTVEGITTSTTQTKITVNGESSNTLNDGDTTILDGINVGVTDITYQDYSGGVQYVTIFLGADKFELENGASMKVNTETISEAGVRITSTEVSGDLQIEDIFINMTAEDDLYVPIGGKLSEAYNLDEPQVLFTQGWDVEFHGFNEYNTEEIVLEPYSGDSKYKLSFMNTDGHDIELPVVYANGSGIYGGEKDSNKLVLEANGTITDDDYFILNTKNPSSSSNDARTYVVQYKGSDKSSDSDPKVKLDIIGDGEGTIERGYDASSEQFTLKLGGTTFTFVNKSDDDSNDFNIALSGAANGVVYAGAKKESVTVQMRTKYNGLLNITDVNTSTAGGAAARGSKWYVSLKADDTERDDDENQLSTAQMIFSLALQNNSDSEISSSGRTSSGTFITDNDNTDLSTTRTKYGALVEDLDTSSAPSKITVTFPEQFLEALVYFVAEDATVGSGGTDLGSILVTDSQVSSVSSKNLIVVGGSCVNTVASSLLGTDAARCGPSWESITGVGAGSFLIQTFDSPFATGKIATLVAGYEAGDTTNAATYLTTETVMTDVGTKYVGTSATQASLITE